MGLWVGGGGGLGPAPEEAWLLHAQEAISTKAQEEDRLVSGLKDQRCLFCHKE